MVCTTDSMDLPPANRQNIRYMICFYINLTKKNIEKSGFNDKSAVYLSDSHLFLKRISNKNKFDCIFMDPPFGNDILYKCLKFIGNNDCLTDSGFVVVETSSDNILSDHYGKISLEKQHTYGYVSIYIYKIASDTFESIDNR